MDAARVVGGLRQRTRERALPRAGGPGDDDDATPSRHAVEVLEGAWRREAPRAGDWVRGYRKRAARAAGEHWTGPRYPLEPDAARAVRPAPVLDDLAVVQAEDRGPVDRHALAGRRDVVVGAPGVRAAERPVRHDEITGFDQQIELELHVGERRARLLPELVLVTPDVGANDRRIHPLCNVARELGREDIVDGRIVAGGHARAVGAEDLEVA